MNKIFGLNFRFSLKTTLITLILITLMTRASFWQWERHLLKEELVKEMQAQIYKPILELEQLEKEKNPLYRRIKTSGEFDFKHEIILRNRKHEIEGPGVHVLTPLKITNTEKHILVDRGFIPFHYKGKREREQFRKIKDLELIGLIKPIKTRKKLSPKDRTADKEKSWIDEWLRVDIPNIEKQLPYKLENFYIEIMSDPDPEAAINKVVSTSSGRQDIFFITDEARKVSTGELRKELSYPIPAHSAVIPSATHLSYVFEWGFMALMTLIISIIMQLKRPSQAQKA